jgi:hypothetical protein
LIAIGYLAKGRTSVSQTDRDRRLFHWRVKNWSSFTSFALSVTLAASASGCASASGASSESMPQQRIAGETVGYFFAATVTQSAHGVMFRKHVATLQRAAFRECISRLRPGQDDDAYLEASSPFNPDPIAPGYVMALGANYGVLDLKAISRSGMLVPIVIVGHTGSARFGLSASKMRALSVDGLRCQRNVAQRVVELYTQLNQRGEPLVNIWLAMVSRTLAQNDVRNAHGRFTQCLKRNGVPSLAAGSILQFAGWLMSLVNPGAVKGRSSTSLPEASQAAVDGHWSAVFVSCAAPLVTLLQRLLPRLQTIFLQAHSKQVAALEALVGRNMSDMKRLSQGAQWAG